MNTPQFDWVLSRLPRRPQPVPPIYQPELIARAVVRMAEHPRREMWLTERTILTIVGNRIVPGYIDRRLGRDGIASQQTDEPADPDRPANLWQPVAGDHGAHGAFDDQARASNPVVTMSLHRQALVNGALAAIIAVAAARLGSRLVSGRD